MSIQQLCLILIFAPLAGSILAGLFSKQLGREGAHVATIAGVAVSFVLSLYVAGHILLGIDAPFHVSLYTWASGEELFSYGFNLGLLIDQLTVLMLVVVTFVSLLVHVYSIGYMADDPGYERFFSYISLFTFMMLMLVSADNFLQLFFGWEGVGLVSYLLIGFWYQKEAALQGSLKAFIVNRVGDFGFILAIALIFTYTGSLDYQTVFNSTHILTGKSIQIFSGTYWVVITPICLLLFVGAMGKSAQVPMHVWLPESMEGPTPISALIHAATMVTAGVFMVARFSPLFEYSETALSFILVIGGTGALFTGILAVVMNDIKRVVAYSTLSQLGYMMVAMGASAYSAGMFHLVTHACFKALLFLGAGSVIIALHHEQDMRKMGGLRSKMPITYYTFLIGSLALAAIPPFSGFFSKDTIIEAVSFSQLPGSQYAYVCVVLGAMVTGLYTFRMLFMTFHGQPRMDKKDYEAVKESPWVVWFPLVALAIPSLLIGYFLYMPILFDKPTLLGHSIFVMEQHNTLSELAVEMTSPLRAMIDAPHSMAFWLALIGILVAWVGYIVLPGLPGLLAKSLKYVYRLLLDKYGFDAFNNLVFVKGAKLVGRLFYKFGDQILIDGLLVNGTAKSLRRFAGVARLIQTGYLYHYIMLMVFGLFAFLCWLLLA